MSGQEPQHLPSASDDPPLPPTHLSVWTLPLLTLPSTMLYRGHWVRRGPIFFNPRHGRWSSGDGAYATLYLATQPEGAFLEAFGHLIAVTAGSLWVSTEVLEIAGLSVVTTTRPLRLVDVTHGAALAALAVDSRITNGPHQLSQQWSRAFWAHPSSPDGILYRSRRAPDQTCIALFDRAADAVTADAQTNLMEDPQRRTALLRALTAELVDT